MSELTVDREPATIGAESTLLATLMAQYLTLNPDVLGTPGNPALASDIIGRMCADSTFDTKGLDVASLMEVALSEDEAPISALCHESDESFSDLIKKPGGLTEIYEANSIIPHDEFMG